MIYVIVESLSVSYFTFFLLKKQNKINAITKTKFTNLLINQDQDLDKGTSKFIPVFV